jgi:dTDP-4-dehydrorhamnose reductase
LLGVNLALEAAKEHTVFGLVNQHLLTTDAFSVVQADLLAPKAVQRVLDEVQPEWVIHCAALADVDACEANPQQASKLNSELPRTLASHVARGGARLLHISTDAVFDGRQGDYTEDDPPNPVSVYARTKLLGEQSVAKADPTAIIARVNLFGWSPVGRRSLSEFFFYNLRDRVPVMGFTDVFFCPLLVNHLAHILLKMLSLGLSGLYHVVSSECTSKYQFGVELARQFGLDESLITPTSVADSGLKAARSPNLTLKVGKLAEALKEELPNLSTGLEGFYSLYQKGYPQKLISYGTSHRSS